ncbi:response regulator [Bacillus sp. H-16]|uniref:response regulator transcription factor n=1 Tax=Alteribacter salitolerans TaxID=2912333 RepID=UPI001964ACE3|nr:response regulator [Alteribacter salitolerans]MBM7095688.1 response regulator [Alteribacter salitolerans]
MTTLLIVDDEWLIREGLLKTIPWSEWGINVLGAASNGKEAASLIALHEPDILLTDIRMAGMDGLALMEHCSERYPDMKSIILTGHNEFEYAQKALKLGARDLLLKPTDEDELRTTMEKILGELETDRSEKKDIISLLTREVVSHPANENIARLKDYFTPSPPFGFVIVDLKESCEEITDHYTDFAHLNISADPYKLELLIYNITDSRSWPHHIESLLSTLKPQTAGVSSVSELITDWSRLYEEAKWAIEQTDLANECGYTLYQSTQYTVDITKAVHYIDSNFNLQLSQAELADYFHISTSQFSKLFKQLTGKNFVDYITDKRLTEAKRLLRETSLKTYEIAVKVGYTDSRYFSQTFKKKCGVTPKEYRKQED